MRGKKKGTAEAFTFWRPGTKQSQRKGCRSRQSEDQATFKHFSDAGHILAMMPTADRLSAEEDISDRLLAQRRGKKTVRRYS